MNKLSVVIITYNEAHNIRRCLESVKSIADDIVVIDSFSTDGTPIICHEYDVQFFQKTWEGYSAAKNDGNAKAKYDWVFSIDADEALSEELINSILEVKKTTASPVELRIQRLVNYCGKWIRHGGWYPDIKLRFFDRTKSKWEGVVHERLTNVDEGNAFLLKGPCYHYTYYTVEEHVMQTEHFSTLAAQQLFSGGRKANTIKMLLSPTAKFIGDYIFRLGFLDGQHGFKIAKISAWASYLKYKKLKEFHSKSN